jgi:hypothetical protein
VHDRQKHAIWVAMLACVVLFPVQAAACSGETEEARRQEAYGPRLPDCRAYEQVSPIDKNTTDAAGKPWLVQSSPDGDSVTYYSVVPFPGIANASEFPTYLSTREGDGWSTQGLLPPAEPTAGTEVLGVTEDNGESIVGVGPEEGLLLAPGAKVGRRNAYVRNSLTGGLELLGAGASAIAFDDATPDGSRILFTSTGEELVPGVVDGVKKPYLYEWNGESDQLSFVGSVNGQAPQGGTVAGTNETEGERKYDQNTISEDGARIFFSERTEKMQIYMLEPSMGITVEVSTGPAQWRAATPNGERAFYTEEGNLYAFDAKGQGTQHKALTTGAAGVLGVVGISDDGAYAYFVAEGVLPGENEESAINGADNLYEWHEGLGSTGIRFIDRLNTEDEADWRDFFLAESGTSAQGAKAARVTPDGTKVLFSSTGDLTSYNNANYNELYLYNATEGISKTNPHCISCNPTREPATKGVFLARNELGDSPLFRNAFLTRNLSAEGTRVFFQTEEALVPGANEQMNVYEWEQEGAGTCARGGGDGSGGCLYLISTGQSTTESYFGDASADGSDVFFFTRQSLVGQDRDDNVDIYDAREEGGIAAQNVEPALPCEGETCRNASPFAPVFNVPSSATFTGMGNAVPQSGAPQGKPKPKGRHHRAMRRKSGRGRRGAKRGKRAKKRRNKRRSTTGRATNKPPGGRVHGRGA